MRQDPIPGTRLVVEPGDAPADLVVGALSLGIAGAVGAGRVAFRMGRPFARLVLEPPLVPASRQPVRLVEALTRRGRADRALVLLAVNDAIDTYAPQIVDRVLRAVPLTDLITENVDIEAIVKTVDLAGLTQQVIDEIDLPDIIRQSTGSMTTETVRGVRIQSYEADQAVERVLGRMHLRRRARPAGTPEGVVPVDGETPT